MLNIDKKVLTNNKPYYRITQPEKSQGGVIKDNSNLFTVQELAQYLRMKPLTIYKHASTGQLPGFKVGSHWRFKKETIDQWIKNQEKLNSRPKVLANV